MNFKVLRSISTLGSAGLLVLGAASASFAQDAAPQPTPESTHLGTGSLLFGGVTEVPIEGATEKDRVERKRLDDLRGTQSAQELQELATSDAPAVLLYDTATGQYLAGYETEPTASSMPSITLFQIGEAASRWKSTVHCHRSSDPRG